MATGTAGRFRRNAFLNGAGVYVFKRKTCLMSNGSPGQKGDHFFEARKMQAAREIWQLLAFVRVLGD